jgi:hypothetical protein
MRKVYLTLILIFIASFFLTESLPAKNSNKLLVGVLEFDEKNNIGVDKSGVIILEILVTHLKNIGKYKLSERTLLKEILKEQELQMTGLIDNKTAVRVGKIYGLEAIVVGSSMKIVNTITISGRIISVKTGEIIATGVIKFQDAEKLEDELEGLAYQLSGTSKDEFIRLKAARQIYQVSHIFFSSRWATALRCDVDTSHYSGYTKDSRQAVLLLCAMHATMDEVRTAVFQQSVILQYWLAA